MNYNSGVSGLGGGYQGYQGQLQSTANMVAKYLRAQDPEGQSTAADLIQMTLPGNLNKGFSDSLASLLGLGTATDALGATDVAGVLGAGAGAGGAMASLY